MKVLYKKIKTITNSEYTFNDVICYLSTITCNYCYGFWGTLLLKIKAFSLGVKLGKNVKCYGRIIITRGMKSTITIGNNVTVVSNSTRCTSASIFAPTKIGTLSNGAKISIGNNVGLNGTSIVARSKTIDIGDNTIIAPNVTIMDSDFHPVWPLENRLFYPGTELDRDVIIGKNVWICSRVIILKGSTIGDNSVIAAGSVVNKNIPCNVVAGGVPAKIIKKISNGK